MGYNGYFIKILSTESSALDYIIPMEYILFQSYKGTYSTLDSKSTRNGNGVLIRTVLPHKVAHCTVDIRSLPNTQVGTMLSNIQSRYVKEPEKKVLASIWVAELNDYVEAEFYIPDIEFTVKKVEDNKVFYEQFTLEFIGY